MATKKNARSNARAVSPIDINSNVKETDVVLVNRNQTDSQTSVEDLAKGVGGILNVDGLAVEIDTNADNISEIALEIGVTVGNGNGQPPVNGTLNDRLGKLENHNFEGGASAAGENPTKGTHQKRLDTLEAEVGIGGGSGSITDQLQAIDAEQALQDGWIGRAAGSAIPGKSHEVRITDLEGRVDGVEDGVAVNTLAITKNEGDITLLGQEVSKLSGALVYKGVADFNQAPPAAVTGEFYAASGEVASPDAGWGASGTVSQGDYYAFNGSKSNGWAKVGNTDTVHDVVDDFHVTAISGNAASLTYSNATEVNAAIAALELEVAKKLAKNISTLPALTA